MENKENIEMPSTCRRNFFELKKWNGVAMWSWDIEDDICAICKNQVFESCIECQAQRIFSLDTCNIAWGVCNHVYHEHCIFRWLEEWYVCPVDTTERGYKKIVK